MGVIDMGVPLSLISTTGGAPVSYYNVWTLEMDDDDAAREEERSEV